MSKPILLIDGDQFLMRATAAVEKETRWDDQNHVLYSNENEAFDTLKGMIERIFTRFDSREHALCFGTGPYFRHDIDPAYKAGRTRKPLCYALMRDMVEKEYHCITMHGIEADDVMGILATKPGTRQRVIVSQDKDMKSVPTTVWNGEHVITYSETEADYFHMYQTLTGDVTDGYKGCPGIGPKKATEILDKAMQVDGVLWPRVVGTFEKAKLTADDALKQARLARILRWSDWDGENKKPVLWTPLK